MPRCNGCGFDRKTSREHLIHFGIGRAILGDGTINSTEEMRRRIEKKTFLQAAKDARRLDGRGRLIKADMFISNLLCEECNNGWARELEEQAGAHLFAFLNNDAPMDRGLLGRWIRFFAIKCGVYYQRTEWLGGGNRPLLRDLADPKHPGAHMFMAEMADRPNVTWAYYQRDRADMWRGVLVVTQSVVWFLPFSDSPPPNLVVTQPRDGTRRSTLAKISVSQLYGNVIVQEALDEVTQMWPEVLKDMRRKGRV